MKYIQFESQSDTYPFNSWEKLFSLLSIMIICYVHVQPEGVVWVWGVVSVWGVVWVWDVEWMWVWFGCGMGVWCGMYVYAYGFGVYSLDTTSTVVNVVNAILQHHTRLFCDDISNQPHPQQEVY